ncbi:MAG: hypothetical protein H7Y15_17030 [Pseudonocardia sp.]|nr:hypothetical protein [Pseudonocardia sp.]
MSVHALGVDMVAGQGHLQGGRSAAGSAGAAQLEAPGEAESLDGGDQIRRLTGHERVVINRFDGDEPGHVIAEDRHPDRESWLGLWFPAIDVPQLPVLTWAGNSGDGCCANVDDGVVNRGGPT